MALICQQQCRARLRLLASISTRLVCSRIQLRRKDTALLHSSRIASPCFICVKPVALITYSDVCIAAFIQLHLLLYKLRTLAFLLPGITSYICTSRLIVNRNCFPVGLEESSVFRSLSYRHRSFVPISGAYLTLILLTWRIWWAPNSASKGQMGFNSAL